MNILVMTNTYKPIVGGLERSIEIFSNQYRKYGHKVLIVAPDFEDAPRERGVVRIPALQKIRGTDFSVHLPIPGVLSRTLKRFKPDIVHSHQPFLMGETAFRIAAQYDIPLVFTFHTLYERYTYYMPGNPKKVQRFVIRLASGYANLCDYVFAPSRGVAQLLRRRKVMVPIETIPTGIDVDTFKRDDSALARRKLNLPQKSFVVGSVGRINPEKNIHFLIEAVKDFMKANHDAHFLLVGKGLLEKEVTEFFRDQGLKDRFHFTGVLFDEDLVCAYRAMDVFVFASKTETQGIVLNEAMATEVPVIALAGPGVNDIVIHGLNGHLLHSDKVADFTQSLKKYASLSQEERFMYRQNARNTALRFSLKTSVIKALDIYEELIRQDRRASPRTRALWSKPADKLKTEWRLLRNLTQAMSAAFGVKLKR
ncbi:MAG: glycosyltransferase [Candidatus Omnitrophica bacterium]|nr:glycosyltransferase [Candidatus Omnitrophota bacterium]